jgi:hypothetical protein
MFSVAFQGPIGLFFVLHKDVLFFSDAGYYNILLIYNIITHPDWLTEERLDSTRYRYERLEHAHTLFTSQRDR